MGVGRLSIYIQERDANSFFVFGIGGFVKIVVAIQSSNCGSILLSNSSTFPPSISVFPVLFVCFDEKPKLKQSI